MLRWFMIVSIAKELRKLIRLIFYNLFGRLVLLLIGELKAKEIYSQYE